MVSWKASARDDVENRKLKSGGHVSLIFNPDVYEILWEKMKDSD